MSEDKASAISSDRLQWQKLFKHLVHNLKAQHSKIESLVTDRKLLEDRIHVKYDRFVSEVRILEDQISQNKDFTMEEMAKLAELKKLGLNPGFKQRDSSLYKRERDEQRCRALETEVKKLKRQNENLTSKHKTEFSALMSERIFLLNQLKKMESDRMEKMQSSDDQMNEAIVNLKANIAKLVENMVRSDIEMSTQSRELTLLTILKLQAKVAKLEEDMVRSN